MPNAADLPKGRMGNYRCPFCDHRTTMESDMILHRADGPCAARNELLRQGKPPVGILGTYPLTLSS